MNRLLGFNPVGRDALDQILDSLIPGHDGSLWRKCEWRKSLAKENHGGIPCSCRRGETHQQRLKDRASPLRCSSLSEALTVFPVLLLASFCLKRVSDFALGAAAVDSELHPRPVGQVSDNNTLTPVTLTPVVTLPWTRQLTRRPWAPRATPAPGPAR